MARLNYERLRSTATRLIGNAGQPGMVRRTISGTGPSWDPGPETYQDYACTFVEDAYSAFEIDGTLIRQQDRKLIVSPSLAVTPMPDDRFVIGDAVLEIVRVTPTSPGGMPLMFTIQVRS